MINYIIEPLKTEDIKKIFDEKAISILNKLIQKSALSHPPAMIGEDNINFQIPKEYLEYYISQSIGAKPLGAGHYPVDIKTPTFLADIKSMRIDTNKDGTIDKLSGETSLGQKFTTDTPEMNLDTLFQNKERDKIKDIWVNILQEKYLDVIKKERINQIYYIFIMRA